ncbi:MAG: hypothetical protein EPO35_04685 [Acidobacteria bacterium]|nr:MAG: hypothetical protein EPO35_04685 [Acidobacteriota bacterium]
MGLSQSFNADLTFHTDFAQVEADQEVVNLSRFSLFFPEKRQFFTESAGIFDYGQATGATGGPGLLTLFYSRRIGLRDGQEVPILAGARVTGRAGHTTVGAMNIETDAATATGTGAPLPRANYTIARVKRDIFSRSSIGAMVLNRTGGGLANNGTAGVDGVFTFGKHLDVMALGARTFTPDRPGRDWAGAMKAKWTSDRFETGVGYLDIAEKFNAEMGFVPRTDIRNVTGQAAWTPRPKWRGVRQLRFNIDTSYYENHAGRKESAGTGYDFTLTQQSSASLGVSLDTHYDYLDEDWLTSGGRIALGGYRWNTLRLRYSSNQARRVYGSLTAEDGGYYNGDKRSYQAEFSFLPLETLLVENFYRRNRVVLPVTGAYTTNVLSTRISYSFTPALFLKSFVQYNDQTRTASANVLLWFIYRPGSDLYVVYNQGWETDAPGPQNLRTRGRSIAVKLTYWLSR